MTKPPWGIRAARVRVVPDGRLGAGPLGLLALGSPRVRPHRRDSFRGGLWGDRRPRVGSSEFSSSDVTRWWASLTRHPFQTRLSAALSRLDQHRDGFRGLPGPRPFGWF